MKYIVLAGRLIFATIFFAAILKEFSEGAAGVASSTGIPFVKYFIPVSGVLAVVGALSLLIGYKAKLGAWLLIIFLIPVTILMHPFWKETELFQTEMQLAMFAKNISLLGAALIISYVGAGPVSFDAENKSNGKSKIRLNNYSPLQSLEWYREHLKKYV